MPEQLTLIEEWRPAHTARYPARILRLRLNHGYHRVGLVGEDGKQQWLRVHRLVLEAFVGPCPEGHEGAHRDGIKLNNRLCNLRWATPKENAMDRQRHDTQVRGVRQGLAKLTPTKVREIRRRMTAGERGASVAKDFDIDRRTAGQVYKRETWRHVD